MSLQVTWGTKPCVIWPPYLTSLTLHSIIYWTNDNAAWGTVREDQGLELRRGQSLPSVAATHCS